MPRRIRLIAMIATLMFTWVSMPSSNAAVSTYSNPALGVRLTHPASSAVLEDLHVADTFGFSIVEATPDTNHPPLLLRVAQVQRAVTTEEKVRELRAQFADLRLQQEPVTVGRLQGIAVAGVPGADGVTTYVYLAANNRVYEIIYGGAELDDRGWVLLNGLRFTAPRATLASLRLPSARDTLTVTPPAAVLERQAAEEAQLRADAASQQGGISTEDASSTQHDSGAVTQAYEVTSAPGCADWPHWKTLRIPWDRYARGNGWSKAGPSWYGEGGHIRCNTASSLNDHHAIDFPLREWDSVYAQAPGRVLYAGWASGGWARAGRVVILDLGNGYWSASFHLRSITVSTGQTVNADTRIGYAGGSGMGRDGYFGNHLHQALYVNARLMASQGGVYGGQSVEPFRIRRPSDGYIYPSVGRYAWMRY